MSVSSVPRGARPLSVLAALVLFGAPLAAQNGTYQEATTKESWMTPPSDIANVVLAPRYLNVSLNNMSPNRKQFLRLVVEDMPTQAKFARPNYYLGGLQIDYVANRVRTLSTRGVTSELYFQRGLGGQTTRHCHPPVAQSVSATATR